MKQYLVFILVVTGTTLAAQTNNWKVNGNNISPGEFIGTTNNRALLFKVDNTDFFRIGTNGSYRFHGLSGNGDAVLLLDNNGNATRLNFNGNAATVLAGNGTFVSQNSLSGWQVSGNNIIKTVTGNVGIGVANPLTALDVNGDARISNNLYVGGGIIITDKVNANLEVVTAAVTADSIKMDSTKAFYGYAKFKDFVKLENDLDVTGNAQMSSDLKVSGDIVFGTNRHIRFVPGNSSDPPILHFGIDPATGWSQNLDPCIAPQYNTIPTNRFDGLIQAGAFSAIDGTFNMLAVGFDGANGIIDLAGSNSVSSYNSKLLINYNCGKDVYICTGAGGGTLYAMQTKLGQQRPLTGSLHDDAMLSVDGKIVAKSCYVTLTNWADYVFEPGYKLRTIAELENYYKTNKHLPDVPSAKEVIEGGLDVGEMNKLLLRKIEELTLYLVQQQKEIELLKAKTN